MPPTLSPQDFVAKWSKSELKERSSSQEHFIDLCRLVGHQTPAEADPTGTSFCFEMGASKHSGGQGWADVWKKGYFAWEYKGKHRDLNRAYDQLLQYRESLQNPPLLIVSDIDRIIVHTNFTNTVKQVVEIGLQDLLKPAELARVRDVFYHPAAFQAPQSAEQVTEAAAAEFSRLAEHLRRQGGPPERAAHFLIRLLFCLFAEDVDLLPEDVFSRLVTNARSRPEQFGIQLQLLFDAMSAGGWFGTTPISHFDGRLFDDAEVIPLGRPELDVLAGVCDLDWGSIEPSIFGTLFERSLDPDKRSQLGAHYTSKEDILLIVEPVLMAPLRRRWEAVKAEAAGLARRRDEAATPRTRNNRQKELTALLTGFAGEVAAVQVLDPACGSGNFLYVALRQLLDLEKEIVTTAAQLGTSRFFPQVSPAQLHGIEINPYAHQLAQATIWIGYIQWLRENGFGFPPEPILKPLDTILQMDAILAYDEQGRPVEPEWPAADVIIGNPPFLGNKRMRSELGSIYVDDLRSIYESRIGNQVDLVCFWFEKARAAIAHGATHRAGLLATQAIRAGANQHVLARIAESGAIFYAQADRPWILDGASVRVSMVGFDDGTEKTYLINESTDDDVSSALANAKRVRKINTNLTSGSDLTQVSKLRENRGICFQGTLKVGPFDIPSQIASQMLRQTNPHGRSNSDVIRPWSNATDITSRNRDMWIIDFGPYMNMDDASLYEQPFEYVRAHVLPQRAQVRRKNHREKWWIFGEARPGMREALATLPRYIVTPRVAKHRLFVFLDAQVVPDGRLYVFARDDAYFFGVLHSRLHENWSLVTSSRHGVGNDPTYNNTTCFETFPFPWPPGREPAGDPRVEAIAEAARDLVEKRARWLNPEGASEKELKRRTLTNLYNQRPTWLDLAHQRLDQAVLDAYGWPHDLSDEQILERLLALNLERAAGEG